MYSNGIELVKCTMYVTDKKRIVGRKFVRDSLGNLDEDCRKNKNSKRI